MKIPSLINRLKSVKKHLKGMRFTVALAVVAVLLVGTVSVAAYTMNLEKKKEPVVEKVQSKPIATAPMDEPKPAVAAKGKPTTSDSTQPVASNSTRPTAAQTNKPVAQQPTKPRPHTSEDPAFVACVQKYSDLYVQYNADNANINVEKNLALATIDELYNSGYYEELYPGDTGHYNYWQMDRAELVAEYDNQLAELYNTYAANSSVYLNC